MEIVYQKQNESILHRLLMIPVLIENVLHILDNISIFQLFHVDKTFYTRLATRLRTIVCSDTKFAKLLMSADFVFSELSALTFKDDPESFADVTDSFVHFTNEKFPKLLHLKLLYDCNSVNIDEKIRLHSFECDSDFLLSLRINVSELFSLSLHNCKEGFLGYNFEQVKTIFSSNCLTRLALNNCFVPPEFYSDLLPTLQHLEEFELIHLILSTQSSRYDSTWSNFWKNRFVHITSPYLVKLKMDTTGPLRLDHSKQLESVEIADLFGDFFFTFLDQNNKYLSFPYLKYLNVRIHFKHLLPFLLSMNSESLPSVTKIHFCDLPIAFSSTEQANCCFGYQITEEEYEEIFPEKLEKCIFPDFLKYTSSLSICPFGGHGKLPREVRLSNLSLLTELELASREIILDNLPNLVCLKILSEKSGTLRHFSVRNVPRLKHLQFFSHVKDCCIAQFPQKKNSRTILQKMIWSVNINWEQIEVLALPIVSKDIEEREEHPFSASNVLHILKQTINLQTLCLLWPLLIIEAYDFSFFPISISQLALVLPKLRHLELFSLHLDSVLDLENFQNLELLQFVDCMEISNIKIHNMPKLETLVFQRIHGHDTSYKEMKLSLVSCSHLKTAQFLFSSLHKLSLYVFEIPSTFQLDFSPSYVNNFTYDCPNHFQPPTSLVKAIKLISMKKKAALLTPLLSRRRRTNIVKRPF